MEDRAALVLGSVDDLSLLQYRCVPNLSEPAAQVPTSTCEHISDAYAHLANPPIGGIAVHGKLRTNHKATVWRANEGVDGNRAK